MTEAEVIAALGKINTDVAREALADIAEGEDVWGTWETVAYAEAVPAMIAYDEEIESDG